MSESYHHAHKPKFLSIGLTPLGVISIGVVPMGVISIGIVPMGLLSVGSVAMGVFSAGLVSMGAITAGFETMGLVTISSPGRGHGHNPLDANRENLQPHQSHHEGQAADSH